MLTNATILRIDTLAAPTAGGDAQFNTGASCSIRCCKTDPTFMQKQEINQVAAEMTDTIYIELRNVLGVAINGARLSIKGDRETSPSAYIVRKAGGGVKAGGLDYVVLYGRAA